MNTKRIGRWVIVLFLLAALPVMTAVMAQGEEPASETPTIVIPSDGIEAAPVAQSAVITTETGLQPAAAPTFRVSVSSTGVQGNGVSDYPSISDNGRFVAFASLATNLVPGDTNGAWDVFVHDIETGTTTRVSVNSAGVQGNGRSEAPVLSADGRYVVFGSYANNLVAGDTNGVRDTFVHDRQTGVTTRVSVSSTGAQANGTSAFYAISADGRFVTFQANASNLVAGDTNGKTDVFVHDRQIGVTTRVSVSSTGVQSNSHSQYPDISADGHYVVFESDANNLVVGDSDWIDVFLHDRWTGTTVLASLNTEGGALENALNPVISDNGRWIAFESSSFLTGDPTVTYLTIMLRDREAGTTIRAHGDPNNWNQDDCFRPAISADGGYVAFDCVSGLVPPDTNGKPDIFVHARETSILTRASVSSAGVEGNGASEWAALSGDGQRVVFASSATNLVSGDTNSKKDVFVHYQGSGDPPAAVNVLAIGDSLTYGYQHMAAQYPLGDPNVDGEVNGADITLYTSWLANPGTIPGPATAAFKRADTDGNGSITIADKDNASAMVNGTYPRAYFGVVVANKTLASYRLPLYQMFRRQANYGFTFIGTVDTNAEKNYNNFAGYPTGAGYPLPTGAQIAFVGQPGKTTANVNSGASPLFGIGPALRQLKAAGKTPHVALIHLGTNDINRGMVWTTSQAALNGILVKLRSAAGGGNPAIKIYVAQIIPTAYPGNPCRQNVTFAASCARFNADQVEVFNSRLESWCGPIGPWNVVRRCANLSTAASPVYLVQQNTIDPEHWLIPADAVHSNRAGECHMAQTWYTSLERTDFPNLPIVSGICDGYPETP